MKILIAGCRGSIPSSSATHGFDGESFETAEFGGNTTCFYIQTDKGRNIVIDAGTGIAPLGKMLMKRGFGTNEGNGNTLDLFITHTHWDHIQGFPFFSPAYIPGNKINVYGEAKVKVDLEKVLVGNDAQRVQGIVPAIVHVNGKGLREVFTEQQQSRNFPAPLDYMKGIKDFYDFLPGKSWELDGLRIETMPLNHPGGCISYKISEEGNSGSKTLVIATDFEPDNGKYDADLGNWLNNADLVIADGQYETGSKTNPFMKGWGHSDPFLDVDFAHKAGVRRLLITHHDPQSQDAYLKDLEKRVQNYASGKLLVDFARERREYTL